MMNRTIRYLRNLRGLAGKFVLACAVLTLATLYVPLHSAAADAPAAAEVKIDNFAFGPQETVIAVNTTVTWTNRDDIPHTIVSSDGAFKSKALDTDDKFTFTFTKAGTYPYFCGLHPKMTAKIVVK